MLHFHGLHEEEWTPGMGASLQFQVAASDITNEDETVIDVAAQE